MHIEILGTPGSGNLGGVQIKLPACEWKNILKSIILECGKEKLKQFHNMQNQITHWMIYDNENTDK